MGDCGRIRVGLQDFRSNSPPLSVPALSTRSTFQIFKRQGTVRWSRATLFVLFVSYLLSYLFTTPLNRNNSPDLVQLVHD